MEQRNIFIAIVLSLVILLGWQFLVVGPKLERERTAQQAAEAEKKAAGKVVKQTHPGAVPPSAGTAPQPPAIPGAAPTSVSAARSRGAVLAESGRVTLESPRLRGSISLKGARFDDLTLTEYRETVEKDSPNITLLSPRGAENPYFAQFGWVPFDRTVKTPGPDTVWTADRTSLKPGVTVTLKWDNGQGLEFRQAVAMDENYMFTVTQSVRNKGAKPVTLAPYGLVSRMGTPKTTGYYILHEGLLGVFGGGLKEVDYKDLREAKNGTIAEKSKGGWIGITDKFWLAALIPDQKSDLKYTFVHSANGKQDVYQVDYLNPSVTVPVGGATEATDRLFAGAKVVRMLDAYKDKLGIPLFDKAVDFGWFYWLTKPIFYALDYLYHVVGNFGIAIMLLTVGIKLLFFPLANKSYKAMSRMKALQPKMTEIRERYKDDRMMQNQAMMELYKKENANPMAGCLPIFIQIPVFFSLYKVLFVTIEMRHAPFFGWIHDLSAPDPLGMLTLFGLVHWDVPHMLAVANIGIWPILMGLTMFLQQRLNPQPADPVQAKVFMFLPLIFTFLLGRFAAGLVIYWTWNNLLSIAQQWVIMRRMGVNASGQKVAAPPPAPPPRGGKSGGAQSNAKKKNKAKA